MAAPAAHCRHFRQPWGIATVSPLPSSVPPAPKRIPLHRGLGARLGVTVLLVELLIFALVAHWQHDYLGRSQDDAFLQRVSSVSALMGRGLLSHESLTNPAYLGPLLGEEPVMAMVLGPDGYIFNAMPASYSGQHFQELPGVDPAWLQEARQGVTIHAVGQGEERRVYCLAPLYAAMDHTPFLYAFFKVRIINGQTEKRQLRLLFLYGSALGVFITSGLLLIIFHRQLFLPIYATAQALRRLEAGELGTRVEGPLKNDQLGALQRGLNTMAQSLEETVTRLQEEIVQRRQVEDALRRSNETLEQRVLARTQELEDLNSQLTQEVAIRQGTEAALRESNCQLQGVLDNSPTAIFLVDVHHRVHLCNARFSELYGLPASPSPEDLPDPRLESLFPPEVAAAIRKTHDAVQASGTPRTVEETIPRGDGFATLMTTAFPMRNERGRIWAVCSIATDITDRKRLEAETVRAGQLASIGELAAGVAHEINNPINGIINYAQLLLDDAADPARPMLASIIRQAERVAGIVRSLLAYSRVDEEAFAPVNLAELIEDSLSLTRYRLERSGVLVDVELSPGLPVVRGRPRELQQVLLNLLSNALHALTERQRRTPGAELRCTVRATLREDRRVALQVEDTGTGIPAELLPKVTLPFFTTKPKEQGTGLGLSISRAIVEAHGGEFSLHNVEDGPGVLAQAILPVWP